MAGVTGDGDLARDPVFTVQALIFGGERGRLVFAVPDRFAVFKALLMGLSGQLAFGQTGFHGAKSETGREIKRQGAERAAGGRADTEGLDHPSTFAFIDRSHAQA